MASGGVTQRQEGDWLFQIRKGESWFRELFHAQGSGR